jgi:hypothetical protein
MLRQGTIHKNIFLWVGKYRIILRLKAKEHIVINVF